MSSDFINATSAIGSVLSAVVAIMALAYSYHQFTSSTRLSTAQIEANNKLKQYEIKRDYQHTILAWFSDTTRVLLALHFLLSDHSESGEKQRLTLLSKLSAQIEIGRLFFPNLDKGDGFGSEKPRAYQGYRNLTLDFLVFSFNIFHRKDAINFETHLIRLQREFTSIVCEIMNPKDFIEETKKLSNRFFSHNLTYEDFLDKDPDNIDLFFPRKPRS